MADEEKIENYKNTPAYGDKEERRLITLASMENLLKFHEIERTEKHNSLKFYSVFLGGGLTLVFGMAKFSFGIKAIILEVIAISVILLINFLAIKKLLSVRGASNNIYHEYGKRLRLLLNSHSSDLTNNEKENIDFAFEKYIDEQKSKDFLPKASADAYEVYGFYWLNVAFSLVYIIPIIDLYRYLDIFSDNTKIYVQFLMLENCMAFVSAFCIQACLTFIVWRVGKFIIEDHKKYAPNTPKYPLEENL